MSTPTYRSAAERLPWTPALAAVSIGLNGAGLVLVLGGWYGAAHSARVGDGAHWANLSALGLTFAAVGNAVLLAGARARIGGRQRLLARSRTQRLLEPVIVVAAQVAPLGGAVVGLPGQSLFHTAGCPLVAGKAPAVLAAPERAMRSACGWCSP